MPSVLEVHTWREDWAEEQKKTMPEIQQTVRGVAEDGTVLVTPVRTTTQDRASEYLENLDYRYGKGFAPHLEFAPWMREQIETGIDRLQIASSAQSRGAVSARTEGAPYMESTATPRRR
jgi:hypothetical protein